MVPSSTSWCLAKLSANNCAERRRQLSFVRFELHMQISAPMVQVVSIISKCGTEAAVTIVSSFPKQTLDNYKCQIIVPSFYVSLTCRGLFLFFKVYIPFWWAALTLRFIRLMAARLVQKPLQARYQSGVLLLLEARHHSRLFLLLTLSRLFR